MSQDTRQPARILAEEQSSYLTERERKKLHYDKLHLELQTLLTEGIYTFSATLDEVLKCQIASYCYINSDYQ